MAVKLARTRSRAQRGPQPGEVIAGKYRIERVIGEGGMGTVYAAHHQLLDQRVALKLLFDEAGEDKEAAQRFLLEARAAARLQSEHVTRVMDIDTLNSGLPFIVMEYLEGADLSALLDARGPMRAEAVVDYVLQALEAVAQAHALGIIHRDLKPSNLFLATTPDGSTIIKILDFGISKSTFSTGKVSSLTSSRSVLGSPPYMSPEQIRSPRTVDMRTDIWSLGIVMYELLTGRMPFVAEEVGELFAAILEQEPQPIRAIRADIPAGLEKAIGRCLARNRDRRFTDVGELAHALAPFGTGTFSKSAVKVAQTLVRGEELSSPRRRAVAMPGARPHSDPGAETMPAGSELSPTASTVGRSHLTFFPSTTTRKVASMVAGAAAGLVIAVLFYAIALKPSSRATGATRSAPTVVPIVADPPPAVVVTTPEIIPAALPTADPSPGVTPDSLPAMPAGVVAATPGTRAANPPAARPRTAPRPPAAVKPAAPAQSPPVATPPAPKVVDLPGSLKNRE